MYNDKKIVEQINSIIKDKSFQKREFLIRLGELVKPFAIYIAKRMVRNSRNLFYYKVDGLMFEISPKYKNLRLYVSEDFQYQRCLTFAFGTVNKKLYQIFEDELNNKLKRIS